MDRLSHSGITNLDRLPRSGITNLDRLSRFGIIMGLVATFRHNHWIGYHIPMVNTRYNGIRPVAPVNAPAKESSGEVAVEAGVEEDLGVEAKEEWRLLEIGYQSKMIPKIRPLPYIMKR
uniref:'chromo' domain containing protein n=1 Tax=Solanum tuberosum TaxID=4113 RepID=M1AL34_SOLTU